VNRAAITESSGTNSRVGLRKVMSSITMTTAVAEISSVESMPSKASEKSAEVPPGPVMCTASPSPLSPTSSRMESTAGAMRSQPFSSIVIGTKIWAAR
jgi:hypothetical protein